MAPIVNIENLALGFGDPTLFDNLNCQVEAGSILAVVGANGSGKSTFVKTLLGLQTPISGRIHGQTEGPPKLDIWRNSQSLIAASPFVCATLLPWAHGKVSTHFQV